ncbi:unnamed protein product, partial [Urochloa humidicola]
SPDLLSHPHVLTSFPLPAALDSADPAAPRSLPCPPPVLPQLPPSPPIAYSPAHRRPSHS